MTPPVNETSVPLNVSEEQIEKIGEFLRSEKNPLKGRFRALFTLRNINNPLAIKLIGDCFSDSSALLKHELAYCLGQMQSKEAIPILSAVLSNMQEHPMVRHEAGEALGAIGTEECLNILKKFEKDPVEEVSETVELALERINHISKSKDPVEQKSPYLSVDPALPMGNLSDVPALEKVLLDENLSLYERYQAMFTLRDIGSVDSINAIGKGLKAKSALFRHEIAFVLGQLQNAESIQVLTDNLKAVDENEMVRHECAEALGAIGTPECEAILKEYLLDPQRVVKESCEVALDICEYEMAGSFQYADSLQTVE